MFIEFSSSVLSGLSKKSWPPQLKRRIKKNTPASFIKSQCLTLRRENWGVYCFVCIVTDSEIYVCWCLESDSRDKAEKTICEKWRCCEIKSHPTWDDEDWLRWTGHGNTQHGWREKLFQFQTAVPGTIMCTCKRDQFSKQPDWTCALETQTVLIIARLSVAKRNLKLFSVSEQSP